MERDLRKYILTEAIARRLEKNLGQIFKNCVFEKSIFEKINREECVEKC